MQDEDRRRTMVVSATVVRGVAMRGFYTWARATLIAASAAVAVLAARDVPKNFWPKHDTLFWIAVAVGVAATAIDPIVNRLGWRKQSKKALERNEGVRGALAALLVHMVELQDASGNSERVDWKSTGVFAYRVRLPFIPGLRGLRYDAHLRLEMVDPIMPLPPVRYDHGMPGTTLATVDRLSRSWRDEVEKLDKEVRQAVDQRRRPEWWIAKKLADYRWWKNLIQRYEWRKIDKEKRWRLGYSEFRKSRHYHVLVTYPIRKRSNGRVVGVLSVDVRTVSGPDIGAGRLEHEDVTRTLNSAALAVSKAWSG
jgi:hypothetical protein